MCISHQGGLPYILGDINYLVYLETNGLPSSSNPGSIRRSTKGAWFPCGLDQRTLPGLTNDSPIMFLALTTILLSHMHKYLGRR